MARIRTVTSATPAPQAEGLVPSDVLPGTEAQAVAIATKRKGNVVPLEYKKLYGKAQNNGDSLASRLLGLWPANIDTRLLKETGEANGLWNEKWERLNPGMQRMNLGNRMRNAQRQGKALVIVTLTGTEVIPAPVTPDEE